MEGKRGSTYLKYFTAEIAEFVMLMVFYLVLSLVGVGKCSCHKKKASLKVRDVELFSHTCMKSLNRELTLSPRLEVSNLICFTPCIQQCSNNQLLDICLHQQTSNIAGSSCCDYCPLTGGPEDLEQPSDKAGVELQVLKMPKYLLGQSLFLSVGLGDIQ